MESLGGSVQNRWSSVLSTAGKTILRLGGALEKKVVQATLRIFDFFREFGSLQFQRTQQALFTQEHLLDSGGHFSTHNLYLQHLLKDKDDEEYKKLAKELHAAGAGQTINLIPIPGHKERYAEGMKVRLNDLKNHGKVGEGAIFDMGSDRAGHGMTMRIERVNDTYCTLYWANTGAGTETNRDFHPVEIHNGKELIQRVAVMKNVPWEKITESDFLKNMASAVMGDYASKDMPKPVAEDGFYGEDVAIINNMYEVLRSLKKGEVTLNDATKFDVKENKKFWGRPQLGGSCVPSSMWAIVQTVLSDDAYRDMKTDARIRNLQRNYRSITSGQDQSETTKILVANEVQKLTRVYKKAGQKGIPDELKAIRTGLRSRGIDIDADVAITTRSKLTVEEMQHPMTVDFEKKESRLTAEARFKRDTSSKVTYQIEVDDNGTAKGTRLVDRIYLLYLDVAKGEKKWAEERFEQILKEIQDGKGTIDREEVEKTGDLLIDLAAKLYAVDRTRTGLAKQYAVLRLGVFIKNEYLGGGYSIPRDHAIYLAYQNLNVGAYLSKDNIWLQGIQQISKQESKPG